MTIIWHGFYIIFLYKIKKIIGFTSPPLTLFETPKGLKAHKILPLKWIKNDTHIMENYSFGRDNTERLLSHEINQRT